MPRLNGATPLWIAARTLLIERGDDFERRLEQIVSSFDPEAIHDLRVSSRRIREGLALFTPCYPPAALANLDKRFRRVTRLLGDIRNRDEAVLFFTSLCTKLDRASCSEVERLLTTDRHARKKEVERLAAGLKKIVATDLCDRYRQLVNFPCLFSRGATQVDPFIPLADFARDNLSSRLAGVLELVPLAREEGNSAGQHQLRITVKHFRYRLEILSFLLGSSYRKIYTQVKAYQELLGKMHDLDVFAAINRESSFSPQVAATIDNEIADRRSRLFASFATMLTNKPFEKIGETLRNQL